MDQPFYGGWSFFSLRGESEDSLTLARALLSLVKWLTDIMFKSVEYTDERQTMEYQPLVDRTCDLLRTLIETETSCALLHIARLEESGQSFIWLQIPSQVAMHVESEFNH